MEIIKFDKKELVNLEYSLSKEVLRVNKYGSYAYSTILFCNTRKYHGLLSCPCDNLDGENHILLSSFDETVIQQKKSFNFGIHRYPGLYSPRGHKYLQTLYTSPIIYHTYRVGGTILQKEILMLSFKNQILIRYTLVDAHSSTKLQFRPFLAFRNAHHLSKSNMYADTSFYTIQNGVKIKLYRGYPYLHMQFSKKVDYVHYPQWYYNIEYLEEKNRGYDYHEDLMVPGYFETSLKKGESIIFSATITEEKTRSLKSVFEKELQSRRIFKTFKEVLQDTGKQFIVKKGTRTELNAGYPWFGAWGRDTFIALPGLTLPQKDYTTFHAIIQTMINRMRGPLFPNTLDKNYAAYNSVDAPLWFIWALQQLYIKEGSTKHIWTKYAPKIKKVLDEYRKGTEFNIHMTDNYLIYHGEQGIALTWMDAIVDGKPVLARYGYAVEINALWYNAVLFALEAAKENKDDKFIKSWSDYPEKIKQEFVDTFWNPSKGYLADVVNENGANWDIRPNQIFAVSLPYSPLTDDQKLAILDIIEKELLTPRGIRTLSPSSHDYHPKYEGNQVKRDKAYHQGTVWPWLLGHFSEAYLKLHGKGAAYFIEKLYNGFEAEMSTYGIGTIPEIYDGDPPHQQRGAVSQAWSVAELLRIEDLLKQYKKKKK